LAGAVRPGQEPPGPREVQGEAEHHGAREYEDKPQPREAQHRLDATPGRKQQRRSGRGGPHVIARHREGDPYARRARASGDNGQQAGHGAGTRAAGLH